MFDYSDFRNPDFVFCMEPRWFFFLNIALLHATSRCASGDFSQNTTAEDHAALVSNIAMMLHNTAQRTES
jgi:hypothetical protein